MNKPKVIFRFDKEKDLWNIWDTCNKDSSWYDFKNTVHPKLLEICKGKKFSECREELEKQKKRLYDSGFVEIFTQSLQEAWNKINDEYFRRLEKVMKKPIYNKEFIAYITTNIRCPYDYKEPSFMVSFFRDILSALKTCGHEIMHIQFHNTYWNEIEKQIGKEKTADLKEALTVLLNLEFKDLWFAEDNGYDVHRELRKFISDKWKKEKDFEVLLEKSVEYLKE
ncbi:MAG: hypothetical protein PHQ66_02930 [Candidatus Nanoarchaeia archaeon]|nr:hypothetical protein [Candidatus Nanoarchaeia archaeon]MDD5357680.1 hypothetical protein [Candidatus Nanoarchaeia archaeon]MDD5588599.1 hypothetical protein [Candidatus Nanoarchaeia archaeon]